MNRRKSKHIHTEEELLESFDIDILLTNIIENRLTCKEIQEIYNIEQRFMSEYNKKYNLGIKSSWRFQKNKYIEKGIYPEDLYELYINQEKSLREIGKIYNVQHGVVKNALIFFNICDKKEIRPFNYIKYYDNRTVLKDGVRRYRSRIYQDIMEEHLGRKLKEDEVVHHLDFNRNNNDISNLFLFEKSQYHLLYHGYIKSHQFIHPSLFLKEIIPKYENTFLNYNWLYEKYIIKDESIAEISRVCEVSREAVTNALIRFNLIDEKSRRINQYDQYPKNN